MIETNKTKGGRGVMAKNCGNCANACYPPTSMKPMYGAGGMMLICCKPRKHKTKGIELVAPEHKCRDWLQQPAPEEGEQND